MKLFHTFLVVLSFFPVLFATSARSKSKAGDSISDRGADFAVIRRATLITNKWGKVIERESKYTVLAAGMHIKNQQGEYVPASTEIEVQGNSAIGSKTRHKITFLPNIADVDGAIRLVTPDAKVLRSRPLCISYYDYSTGKSVLIAEVKDSIGEVLAEQNKVIYKDCFTDFRCDLLYENAIGGFEQNLILRERPPMPSEFGLNNATTKLQLLTEFFNPPAPRKKSKRVNGSESDIVLDFGAMKMGPGKAFLIGPPRKLHDASSVDKHWERLEGRDFLIEEVQYRDVKDNLQALPVRPVAFNARPAQDKRVAVTKRILPKCVAALANDSEIRTASTEPLHAGFVLDYTLTGTLTNVTLQSDTTYLVTNTVVFEGTTTIEGGTVVKYKPFASIQVHGEIACKTDAYKVAVFTSWQDDSVGSLIAGSTNNPTPAAAAELLIIGTETNTSLKFLRFSHAFEAVEFDNYPATNIVSDCQFVKCEGGLGLVYIGDIWLRNNLLYSCGWAFGGGGTTVHGEHLTVNQCPLLLYDDGEAALRLTNSLLVGVTDIGTVDCNATNSNFVWYTNDPGVFQTVGAGIHYLADGSIYRDCGTTNLSSQVLASIRNKTTYPPYVYSNTTISTSIALAARSPRDSDTPDLGYHYVPLDYVLGNVTGSGCTITVTNGASLGFFYNEFNFGTFLLESNCVLRSQGSPTNLNRFVWYNTVQEQAVTNWSQPDFVDTLSYANYDAPITIDCSFSAFSVGARGGGHISAGDVGVNASITLKNCELDNGAVYFWSPAPGGALYGSVANCLFRRSQLTCQKAVWDLDVSVNNSCFLDTSVSLSDPDPNESLCSFVFLDNLFYRTAITQSTTNVTASNNAYVTNSSFPTLSRMTPTNGTDLILTNVAFTNGPLGSYYQSSVNLVNAGSRTAASAGLYHFTTQASQTKETNSIVDIGFHYVAVDVNGKPLDYDGDGLPDYFEDTNGNGSVGTDESSWINIDSDNDGVSDYIEWLQGANRLRGRTPDSSGSNNLRIYTPLK